MTDQTESEYAELLRSLDRADRIYGDGLSRKAAAAIRALEAKVEKLNAEHGQRSVLFGELRADRDRLAGEVERLKADVLRQMAWKTEAQDELEDICNELPGVAFMDPPDGGSVSIAEQVRRMYAALQSQDAEVARLTSELAELRGRNNAG